AGMAVTAAEDSVFAVRMGDYARRTSADGGDRFLHGLAHLAVAALAFPRPEDLADDGYIGRVTVNGVDAFVRQACHRLEERAAEQGEITDPVSDAPGLEAAWRVWARRTATGATKDARRLSGSTTGIVAKAVTFLTDSGFLQRTGDDGGGTYRTTARYQLQVRDMAGSAALAELLDLGVVPVTDGTPTLLPPEDGDALDLVAAAGLPFRSACPPRPPPPRSLTRVRHVRAVPGPPLLHRTGRRTLRRHRARPARRGRDRARPRAHAGGVLRGGARRPAAPPRPRRGALPGERRRQVRPAQADRLGDAARPPPHPQPPQ